MIVAFSVAPAGGGADEDGSVSGAVAAAVRIVRESDFWKLDVAPEWVAVLPVLPMFRVQLSGSGSFTLVEWFCLAVFFGLWVRNTWAGERSEPPLVTT